MRILGITGGIATGKSAVTRMLAELGAPTISADALAHQLLSPGTATTLAVLAAFPECADSSDPTRRTIDRRALGRLIFADDARASAIGGVDASRHHCRLAGTDRPWRTSDPVLPAAAAEIPLLFEAGLQTLADTVVVVACAETVQIARLCTRLGVTGSRGAASNRRPVAAVRKNRAGRCCHHDGRRFGRHPASGGGAVGRHYD